MRQKIEHFQSIKFLIWTLVALNILLIVMPANATTVEQIRKIIIEEATDTTVPISLAMAIVKTESNFRPDHEGKDGARGLMQILPGTAESLGLDARSLWKPRPNIRAGLEILDGLLDRTDGHWQETILAYGSHRRDIDSVKNQRYLTAVLKSERQFAEQFAALDAISERRREVLSGHDDWGTDPQEQIASYDPYRTQDEIDPVFDDDQDMRWLDEEDEAVSEYTIFRENESPEIEIVIYETEIEPEVIWIPAPRQPNFRPRRFNQRDGRVGKRFARRFGGNRSGRPGRFHRGNGRR